MGMSWILTDLNMGPVGPKKSGSMRAKLVISRDHSRHPLNDPEMKGSNAKPYY